MHQEIVYYYYYNIEEKEYTGSFIQFVILGYSFKRDKTDKISNQLEINNYDTYLHYFQNAMYQEQSRNRTR